jgi:hydrogenase expression/formation protein HypE
MERSNSTDHEALALGKVSAKTFTHAIEPYLGRRRSEVLVRPRAGIDSGIVNIGGGRVMAVTTDPFFVDPAVGWERAAWFAVHIVASDAATTGLRPAYLTVDLNLPRCMTDQEFGGLWRSVSATCDDLGLAIVAGHTARYDDCNYPMLGGATVICVGQRDAYVVSSMAGVGDAVIMTKGAAIETTGIFGVRCGDVIARACGAEVAHAARDLFFSMSVVRDAQLAAEVGVRERGVTGMHDATERGVWGGLVEMADAAGTGMIVEVDAIPLRPESRAVCRLFEVDPYSTSSEGTLLLTCKPHAVSAVIDRLATGGIEAARIGELTPLEEGVRTAQGGRERELRMPESDPFWPALMRTVEEKTGE